MKFYHILFIIPILFLSGCAKCVESHYETVHHEAWTQYMWQKIGSISMMTPIYHPAYDNKEKVCDKYEEK